MPSGPPPPPKEIQGSKSPGYQLVCHLPRVPGVTYLSRGAAGIRGYLLCVQGQTSSAVTGGLAEAVFLRPEVNKLGHSHVHSGLIPQLWPSLLAEAGATLGTRAGELTKMSDSSEREGLMAKEAKVP